LIEIVWQPITKSNKIEQRIGGSIARFASRVFDVSQSLYVLESRT